MAAKLPPIGHFLGQLDSADYGGRGDMLKAARKLRARAKAKIDADRKIEKDFRDRQLTTAEKRGMVNAGTHRWCKGLGGCGGRGYLVGKDGTQLPHGPCKGDGLIRVRSGGGGRGPSSPARPSGKRRPKRRSPGRVRPRTKVTVYFGACGALIATGESLFGTIGSIVTIAFVVVMTVLKIVGLTFRLVGAVSR